MEVIVKNYEVYTNNTINLESGDFIPRPCYMSRYVPFNGPICYYFGDGSIKVKML